MSKIAIIGAGSFSFSSRIIPDLMFFPELRSFELCLMDINAERLELVTRFIKTFQERHGIAMTVSATTDPDAALRGAAYVVATFDVGGLENRRRDIEIPAEYGIYHAIGDTLGAAGIFNALRMAPELLRLADRMKRWCPDAMLINYTNPMAINLRILHDAAPDLRMIGFCHGLEHSRAWLGRLLNLPAENIDLHCAGVNHQMWMLRIADHEGRDLYPALRERIKVPGIREMDRVRFELMELAGYYMTESSYHTSEYLPYFQSEYRRLKLSDREEGENVDPLKEMMELEKLEKADPGFIPSCRCSMGWGDLGFVNEEKLAGPVESRLPLGFDVDRIGKFSGRLFERFKKSVETGSVPPLRLSVEYLARIIHGLETGTEYRIFGNVVNAGLVDNLPGEGIVEVPVRIAGGRFTPQPVGRLPEFCAALNRNFLNVVLLVGEAVRTGNRHAVTQALAVDPATCSNRLTIAQLNELSRRMIDANKDYLDYLV